MLFAAVGSEQGSGVFVHSHFVDVEFGQGITECNVCGMPTLTQASPRY